MSTITELNQRLLALTEAGVSAWLDQIRRSMVEGGELARMVSVESLRGVTSNPAIFEKAILGSTDYDEDLRALAREDLDSTAIYERIAVRDVQLAADVMSEVHRSSNGRDGFVSLEVAPELAHDTDGTLAQVREFWQRVDRRNVMIKIPGTPEGVPAIEQALYEGVNVNVTLLFSLAAYEAVAEAYIRALERRQNEGLALDVNSVASFFVSRVDTLADRKLEAIGRSDLAGTAAVANARAAYRRFKEMSTGKQGRGIVPVVDESLSDSVDVYGDDRVFAYRRNPHQPDERLDAAIERLAAAGHPTITLPVHGAADLGRIFFLTEFSVAVAGWVLELNPFDQPNVQEAKDNTARVLGSGSVPAVEAADDRALRALLADARPPHYVSILAYLPSSPGLEEAVGALRAAIRSATGGATTFGYGPRYLHSIGQLHKGGAPTGRFLQLVNTPERDAEIPGRGYSFGTLIAAQAAGDLETLRAHGLPAERVEVEGDPADAVRSLTARITQILQEA